MLACRNDCPRNFTDRVFTSSPRPLSCLLVRHVGGLQEVEDAPHVPLPQSHHRLHAIRGYRNPM